MQAHITLLLVTLGSGLALTATATAATPAVADTTSPVASHFPISVAELEEKHAAVFLETDLDGNGLISVDEFETHKPARLQGWHRRMAHPAKSSERPDTIALYSGPADDASRPHRRDAMRTELNAELFAELDADGNDQISRAEFSSDNQRAARSRLRKQQMFARLDRNADGVLSTEEFPPRHLIDLDTSGDGQITREEMRSRTNHGPRGPHKRAG